MVNLFDLVAEYVSLAREVLGLMPTSANEMARLTRPFYQFMIRAKYTHLFWSLGFFTLKCNQDFAKKKKLTFINIEVKRSACRHFVYLAISWPIDIVFILRSLYFFLRFEG